MPTYVTATVRSVDHERKGLQKLTVDRVDGGPGNRAYALVDLVGAVAVGDRVVCNTTAVDLGLGTGGSHVVHWNLTRSEDDAPVNAGDSGGSGGTVMKLRYTSLQADMGAAEDAEQYAEPPSLDGLPVVVGLLHSQLATICAAVAGPPDGTAGSRPRVAYVMTDAAGLALPLSDLVHDLRAAGLIDLTITSGQAFGGDLEAVNAVSALGVAKSRGADVVVVAPGPGGVGTGTRLGFGELPTAFLLTSAGRYGGRPILALRWSDADQRGRHRGLSHHSRTVLAHADSIAVDLPVPVDHELARDTIGGRPTLPVSFGLDGVLRRLVDAGIEPSTMGRGIEAEPSLFAIAAAAGVHARLLIRSGSRGN